MHHTAQQHADAYVEYINILPPREGIIEIGGTPSVPRARLIFGFERQAAAVRRLLIKKKIIISARRRTYSVIFAIYARTTRLVVTGKGLYSLFYDLSRSKRSPTVPKEKNPPPNVMSSIYCPKKLCRSLRNSNLPSNGYIDWTIITSVKIPERSCRWIRFDTRNINKSEFAERIIRTIFGKNIRLVWSKTTLDVNYVVCWFRKSVSLIMRLKCERSNVSPITKHNRQRRT